MSGLTNGNFLKLFLSFHRPRDFKGTADHGVFFKDANTTLTSNVVIIAWGVGIWI